MSQMPPPQMQSPMGMGMGGMRPHRGTMILVFGILGLVLCVIFGIVAWVMGNTDLEEMAAGRMDPSGEGLTRAGKICGMVSVFLALGGLCLAMGYFVLVAMVIGAGAAGGAGP